MSHGVVELSELCGGSAGPQERVTVDMDRWQESAGALHAPLKKKPQTKRRMMWQRALESRFVRESP